MQELDGACAVITGGGSGIGRSIALCLAAENVNVVIADIDLGNASKVRDEAVRLGVRSLAVEVDVSRYDAVANLADVSYAAFGSVQLLVNNAGVTLRPFRALWDADLSDFAWVMGVNFWGVVHALHAFLPRMRRQAGLRHVVTTSSFGSLSGVGGHSPYTSSKGAVDGLMKSVARELALDGVGTTTLFSGPVNTAIGTSERLRPHFEQSAHRAVKAWTAFTPTPFEDRLDADAIGPMVLDAIKNGRPYVLTHDEPFPQVTDYLDRLAEDIAQDAARFAR